MDTIMSLVKGILIAVGALGVVLCILLLVISRLPRGNRARLRCEPSDRLDGDCRAPDANAFQGEGLGKELRIANFELRICRTRFSSNPQSAIP